MATVRHLAVDIGPRLATSPEFDRAADWVQRRLAGYGFDTRRQTVRVPAGDSWGVPVDAGTSANVIATPPGFDPAEPWRLVGAHLDTVAVAPGAEDNGSGIAVLLELARLAAAGDTSLPTVFVAFGAEEPVGSGDALHHFGSRLHVDRLPAEQLNTLRAMVSLDRIGVSDAEIVPVCTGGLSSLRVRDDLISVARRLGFETLPCTDNTTSDHWSYEQRGVAVARVGSTPYSAYHSPWDVPDVVAPDQLGRVGRIMWAWLRG
ncbi:MAG: M28 family peptidase [Nocardioidaceae bacterium]|nr:M28 family peptidase [Nocardioidaceae bacterium]